MSEAAVQLLIHAVDRFSAGFAHASAATLRFAAVLLAWRHHEQQRWLSVLRQLRDQRAGESPSESRTSAHEGPRVDS